MTEPYKIRSEETWTAVKADYLAGDSARAVCQRHDVGRSAFNLRAREENWRRRDQPDPDPVAAEDLEPARHMSETREDALARADDAVRRGRVGEAQRWLALAEHYQQAIERDREAIHQAQQRAWERAQNARLAALKSAQSAQSTHRGS